MKECNPCCVAGFARHPVLSAHAQRCSSSLLSWLCFTVPENGNAKHDFVLQVSCSFIQILLADATLHSTYIQSTLKSKICKFNFKIQNNSTGGIFQLQTFQAMSFFQNLTSSRPPLTATLLISPGRSTASDHRRSQSHRSYKPTCLVCFPC